MKKVAVIRHFIICEVCYACHRDLIIEAQGAVDQYACTFDRLGPLAGLFGDIAPVQC
jgi:hypothetical protein